MPSISRGDALLLALCATLLLFALWLEGTVPVGLR